MRFLTKDVEKWYLSEEISLVDAARLRVQVDTYKRYLNEPVSTTIKHLGGFRL